MRYWLYSMSDSLHSFNLIDEVYNVSWKAGNAPRDVAVLVCDDGKQKKYISLGEGFEIVVDTVKSERAIYNPQEAQRVGGD